MSDDLTREALAELLPDREIRSYPAILSTQADAMAWAREGGPDGALVVADYQASPRGRSGLPWGSRRGEGLGFSVVLRPDLPPEREGWLYIVAVSALADALGDEDERAVAGNGGPTRISWPDEVLRGSRRAGAVGVHVELGPAAVLWAVVSFLVEDAEPPRAPLLAQIVRTLHVRADTAAEDVLDDLRGRCATLGMRVRARLIPMGPAGPSVVGTAVDVRPDGSLVLETDRGRAAVPPQNLGDLEEAL